MKNKTILFITFLLAFTQKDSYAQGQPVRPCLDSLVKNTADSVIRSFRAQSFSLVNSASLTMESDYESAIVADFKKGNWYVLAFVGAKTSKLFQVTILGPEQERVAYEKQKSFDKEGNVLIFSYRPEVSGSHLINPLQANKKYKSVCGQLMLFKKDLP